MSFLASIGLWYQYPSVSAMQSIKVHFVFGIEFCHQSIKRKILRTSCPVCCHIICSGANKDKQCSPNILISVLLVHSFF